MPSKKIYCGKGKPKKSQRKGSSEECLKLKKKKLLELIVSVRKKVSKFKKLYIQAGNKTTKQKIKKKAYYTKWKKAEKELKGIVAKSKKLVKSRKPAIPLKLSTIPISKPPPVPTSIPVPILRKKVVTIPSKTPVVPVSQPSKRFTRSSNAKSFSRDDFNTFQQTSIRIRNDIDKGIKMIQTVAGDILNGKLTKKEIDSAIEACEANVVSIFDSVSEAVSVLDDMLVHVSRELNALLNINKGVYPVKDVDARIKELDKKKKDIIDLLRVFEIDHRDLQYELLSLYDALKSSLSGSSASPPLEKFSYESIGLSPHELRLTQRLMHTDPDLYAKKDVDDFLKSDGIQDIDKEIKEVYRLSKDSHEGSKGHDYDSVKNESEKFNEWLDNYFVSAGFSLNHIKELEKQIDRNYDGKLRGGSLHNKKDKNLSSKLLVLKYVLRKLDL